VEAKAAIVVLDAAAKLLHPVPALPPTMVLPRSSRPSTGAFSSLSLDCYVLPPRSVSVQTYIKNIDCGTYKAKNTMIKIALSQFLVIWYRNLHPGVKRSHVGRKV